MDNKKVYILYIIFVLICVYYKNIKIYINKKDEDLTYLDEMVKYLLMTQVENKFIVRLNDILFSEEYETESVQTDIILEKGNISKCVDNEKCMVSMKEFDAITQSMSYLVFI